MDRLFDAPALAGPVFQTLRIAPDDTRITFLKAKDTDKNCLDLWEFVIETGITRVLVDSFQLQSRGGSLSDEEQSRRERQRTGAFRGIVEYAFSPIGNALLFPLAGTLYLCRLGVQEQAHEIQRLSTPGPITDATLSPLGTCAAYIVSDNLVVHDLQSDSARFLTTDGGDVVKNGMAEFVAQEEMDRDTGYWWAPDGTRIAFTRVDEAPVREVRRFEISGDNVKVYDQRYPEAGHANAIVTIGVVDLQSGATTWIDLGSNPDIYVARVNWLPDGQTLAIQRESRDQKRLDLVFAHVVTGESRVVLTEISSSWIELHHELTFLRSASQFIWASSRTGHIHLYLYHIDGTLIRQLTSGNWDVDNFRARAICNLDEPNRTVYFSATAKTPLERHLYRVGLDSGEPVQITQEAGIHLVSMALSGRFYVDQFNSTSQPPRAGVYDSSGKRLFWLLENRLDSAHPSAPYLTTNASTEFGCLTANDGQTLHFRIFKPPDFNSGRRYPAIIEVYGGPGAQRVQNNWAGNSFTQILTRSGFIVMLLDNRGSAHRGTAFQSPIQRQLGQVEVADQLLGAHWLATQPFIDRARLGVWGWSYGGYLTLMLMFKAPHVFRAGIAGAPVTDWHLYDTHYTERYLGTPQDNAAGYEASSVLPLSQQYAGSLLVLHGMADDNVLFSHSTMLFKKLQDLGKQFNVMVYPGAKHGMLRQHDGRHAYKTMLHFFQETLKARDARDGT